jgi:hypothetical protein
MVTKKILSKKQKGGASKAAKSVSGSVIKKANTAAGNKAISSLNNQGKPGSDKKLMKGVEYDSKGRVVEKYDVSGSKGKSYGSGAGIVSRYDGDRKSKSSSMSFLDTTGFAKGKKTFENRTISGPADKKNPVTTKTVKRSAVPSTIKKMQSFKKGGIKKK